MLFSCMQPVLANKNADKISWAPYMKRLEKKIRRNWNPPKANESKRTVVLFKIDRSGKLLSIKTLKTSGFKKADDAARDAVITSDPFEPLPEGFSGHSIDIEFTFDYNIFGQRYFI